MTVDTDPDIRRREAAAWFARLNQRRVEQEDVVAFSQWRRTPENAQAFARLEAMWSAAEVLADDPEILAFIPPTRPVKTAPRRRLKPWVAAAAASALVVIVAIGVGLWFQPQTMATQIGERRVVQLADGSQLTLDTNTRVEVRLSSEERRIDLLEGQAFFDVEHDASRPFVVVAGDTRVTALGTRFDVRREAGSARVVLVDGRVRIQDPARSRPDVILTPGERLDAAPMALPMKTDVARAVSWTTGRIVFQNTPLGEAAAEVNRYTRSPITLQTQLATTTVSGAFDAGDVEGFLAALVDLYPVVIERDPAGGYVVRDFPKNNS